MGKMLRFLAAFLLCVSARAATPVILNFSWSAGAGDIIYLQGSDFGNSPSVEYSYNDSTWKPIIPVTSGSGVITVKIPGNETRLPDILTIRVSADSVMWSMPVFVNKPVAFSFDTDSIAPGSAFRIFGRNLLFSRTPTVRLLDLTDGSSQYAQVDVVHSTHYQLSVVAPSNIKVNNTYQVYISNGYSGNSQTSVESQAAEILKGRNGGVDKWQLGIPWATDLTFYNNVYNVKTDSRLGNIVAKGDGSTDDTWPIMHAIQVASAQGGGVVYLPEGNYAIHFANGCGIPLLPKVVLQGSSTESVNITYGYPEGTSGGDAVCFSNQTGLADLSLTNVDTAQKWQWSALSSGNSEVFMKRVKWNMATSIWLSFVNDDHVAIEDSIISQGNDQAFNSLGPLLMTYCSHCQVSGNQINFVICGQNFDRSSDFIFENNQVTRDISVAPDPVTVTHSIAANFVTNFIVQNNTFASVGNAMPTNNDGEVIVTEGGGPSRVDEFRGSISSATAMTLTDALQNFLQSMNYVPGIRPGLASVAMITGNGLGQTRSVTGVSQDGHTLTIDKPWDVLPDVNDHYATFDWSARNWTVVNNQLLRNFKGFEVFSASAMNLLFEANTLTDSDGIMISPAENAQGSILPGIFHVISNLEIVGNSITDVTGLRPAYVGLIPREDVQIESFGTHIIGARIKSNNVTGFIPNVIVNNPSWDDFKVKSEGYLCNYYWQSLGAYNSTSPPPLLANIFQGNVAINSNFAFSVNSGAAQTVIAGNYPKNSGGVKPFGIQDVALAGASQASRGTVLADSLSLFPVAGLTSSSLSVYSAMASPMGTRAVAVNHSASSSVANSSQAVSLLGEQLSGSAEVSVHVSLTSGSSSTGILVMSSGNQSAGSFVSIGLAAGNIVVTSKSFQSAPQSVSLPFSESTAWLKLSNSGSAFSLMYSPDGINWNTQKRSVQFPTKVYSAGIATVSSETGNATDVVFDSLSFELTSNTQQPVQTAASQASHPLSKALRAVRGFAVKLWRKVRKLVGQII